MELILPAYVLSIFQWKKGNVSDFTDVICAMMIFKATNIKLCFSTLWIVLIVMYHLFNFVEFPFDDAVSDHTFQWLSTGMSWKFLSPWKYLFLFRTSFYISWEGRLAEQIQNSGSTLLLCHYSWSSSKFFYFFKLNWWPVYTLIKHQTSQWYMAADTSKVFQCTINC